MNPTHCDYCSEPHTPAQYDSDGVCKVLAFNKAKEQRFWDRLAAEQPELTAEEQDRLWEIAAHYGDDINKQRKENPSRSQTKTEWRQANTGPGY